ncbi:sugar 3,4-ketoisomerase [Nocardiopsis sediminis]|uniref:Sugar 3,4-ketoisomerase n=1 Tax=Nocardiopsis sediminis TaxID=1778267 RepID=A0ABV8FIX9_9ACTN
MTGGDPAAPSAPAPEPAAVHDVGRIGRIRPCRPVRLSEHADDRGRLSIAETGREVPFGIARAYWQHATPAGAARGAHGHRRLEQVVVAVSGGCDILLDDGLRRCRYRLEDPAAGLYIGPMVWRDYVDFAPGTVVLFLVSEPYDEAEYLRSYDEFRRAAAGLR